MENFESIFKKIEEGAEVDFQEVSLLSQRFPFLVWPLHWLLEHTDDDSEKTILCRKIAVLVGSPEAREKIIGDGAEDFSCFYPDMKKKELSTTETIDTFIDEFGRKDMISSSGGAVPVAPAIDYASAMLSPGSGPHEVKDSTDKAIDAFLAGEEKEEGSPAIATKEELEHKGDSRHATPGASASLSESLAFAMIKKRNYKGALQIISELSLINPEKSVYFADQIRFLKKLILIDSKKNKN